MKITKTIISLLGTALLSSSALAQSIFIKDAKIVTNGAEGILESASILITDGRIIDIGTGLTPPEDAEIVDGDGYWVTPGLFAPFTQIGLVEVGMEDDTNDSRSKDASTSVSERAADSFNPMSPVIDNSRVEGITHAAISARSSHDIFSGTGSIVDTSGDFDSIITEQAFVFVQLGESGAGIAGGSRSASMAHLRAALLDARRFHGRYDGPDDGDALSRQDAEALSVVVRGSIPLVVAADRAVDLLKIIKLKDDYSGLDIIILGASEAWMVADQLAEADIKVMIDPHDNLPGSFETVGARLDNAVLLKNAGVEFAFMSRSSDFSHNVRLLPQHAGNAVGNGLDWDTAFKAISSTPASWFRGVRSDIRASAPATLVVWDGDPLEVTSSPTMIMIDGEKRSLSSRQTELRDRYNPASNETKPHKYR